MRRQGGPRKAVQAGHHAAPRLAPGAARVPPPPPLRAAHLHHPLCRAALAVGVRVVEARRGVARHQRPRARARCSDRVLVQFHAGRLARGRGDGEGRRVGRAGARVGWVLRDAAQGVGSSGHAGDGPAPGAHCPVRPRSPRMPGASAHGGALLHACGWRVFACMRPCGARAASVPPRPQCPSPPTPPRSAAPPGPPPPAAPLSCSPCSPLPRGAGVARGPLLGARPVRPDSGARTDAARARRGTSALGLPGNGLRLYQVVCGDVCRIKHAHDPPEARRRSTQPFETGRQIRDWELGG